MNEKKEAVRAEAEQCSQYFHQGEEPVGKACELFLGTCVRVCVLEKIQERL
jgi:hypothetical protein